MTSKEIFERVDETLERKGLSKRSISKRAGVPYETIKRAVSRKGSRIYLAMDIINGIGLELQFDNKPVNDHQEFIDFVNKRNPVNRRIARIAGVSQGTVQRLREGENVRFDSAMRIVEAMGVEVRVV
jgi:DNA-binding phage protein